MANLAFAAPVDMNDLLGKGVVIKLRPTMSVRVTVKGPDGAPVPNAQVYLSCQREMVSRIFVTDGAGQIVLKHLYHGDTYRVGAVCSGHFSNQPTKLTPGEGEWSDNVEILSEPTTDD